MFDCEPQPEPTTAPAAEPQPESEPAEYHGPRKRDGTADRRFTEWRIFCETQAEQREPQPEPEPELELELEPELQLELDWVEYDGIRFQVIDLGATAIYFRDGRFFRNSEADFRELVEIETDEL